MDDFLEYNHEEATLSRKGITSKRRSNNFLQKIKRKLTFKFQIRRLLSLKSILIVFFLLFLFTTFALYLKLQKTEIIHDTSMFTTQTTTDLYPYPPDVIDFTKVKQKFETKSHENVNLKPTAESATTGDFFSSTEYENDQTNNHTQIENSKCNPGKINFFDVQPNNVSSKCPKKYTPICLVKNKDEYKCFSPNVASYIFNLFQQPLIDFCMPANGKNPSSISIFDQIRLNIKKTEYKFEPSHICLFSGLLDFVKLMFEELNASFLKKCACRSGFCNMEFFSNEFPQSKIDEYKNDPEKIVKYIVEYFKITFANIQLILIMPMSFQYPKKFLMTDFLFEYQFPEKL
ncbi:hypothetical protein EDEG_00641 [Edhazardia aedis USNM 41457]|uniref:Uncharacterized protein n=1 Tax=Edhazardia aedis (strain USNM 41457) TaxID=1003232 RepID=J9DRV7_EDHAE|nr:hypothetical protein EDEG_00641 [Edhazardia aedis USNM 41457]|eukprot:EJW05305.1 hypothetical protein EDEG_00641 [Edhazardia aedis USNM 41457]